MPSKRVWPGVLAAVAASLTAMPAAADADPVLPAPRVITTPGDTQVMIPQGAKYMRVTAWGGGGGGGGGAGGQGGGG
ncbi:hypothetical protein ACSNOK_17990, partial [Streptomyces sp. URMC 126]